MRWKLNARDGEIKGNITRVSTSTALAKVWLVAQAIGDIAFAYPYSPIRIDIQETLKTPPPECKTMKKASIIAVFITTLFYISCGGFGYAAFGDGTPGILLNRFRFYEPSWLIYFENACINCASLEDIRYIVSRHLQPSIDGSPKIPKQCIYK